MSDHLENIQFRLYGIKNCDTVNKARLWLAAQGVAYQFHDYRTVGLEAERLQNFIDSLGWKALLNTRGTTWRRLSAAEREAINTPQAAKALMLEQPAIIKRPLLQAADGQLLLGFNPVHYQHFLASATL